MTLFSAPFFHDEQAAFAKLESIIWPTGAVCPHCGGVDRVSAIKGKSARIGLKFCGHCRKQFTVKVGTVFESSHIPLHKCLQAAFLLTSSKKGFSAHQLHRVLGITYKSAWFLAHRIREAMRTGSLGPMGGKFGICEADETFIGKDKTVEPRKGHKAKGAHFKMKVLSLIDRDTGMARSVVIDDLKKNTIVPILRDNIAKETMVVTDEAPYYRSLRRLFADHSFVNHNAGEYGRGDIHTNTVEGFFSIFKRGMKGVYQHCSHKHLHRYLAEFDFRYSNRSAKGIEDAQRATNALRGVVGKRLTYRRIGSQLA